MQPSSGLPDDASRPILAVSVGNTSIKYGLVTARQAEGFASLRLSDVSFADAATRLLSARREWGGSSAESAPVVLATVNPPAAEKLEAELKKSGTEVLRLGRDIPIHVNHALDDASTVGADRLLNAIAAFAGAGGACIVIDCGTAVTVDFVDGEGTFQGGAIAPGARLMLRAMHQHTAALPLIEPGAADPFPPDPSRGPFGKDTRHAMLTGVAAMIRGMAHHLIDRYAEYYEAYPRVVATGGDAAALFENDELVERVVPELTLLGIGEACRRALEEPDEDDEP